MSRTVTLFTGQWADLPLDDLARKAQEFGYDGLELACWGDHFDVDQAVSDDGHRGQPRAHRDVGEDPQLVGRPFHLGPGVEGEGRARVRRRHQVHRQLVTGEHVEDPGQESVGDRARMGPHLENKARTDGRRQHGGIRNNMRCVSRS